MHDPLIRPEEGQDRPAIRAVHLAAFDTSLEADLVDELRRSVASIVSLVAEDDAGIVGHIVFSPVALDGHDDVDLMGLGPMSVIPDRQGAGVGSLLVGAGIERCRGLGCLGLVVVGHPAFYPRFGFVRASRFGMSCEYDVPPEAFMVLELQPGSLSGRSGVVRYASPFDSG